MRGILKKFRYFLYCFSFLCVGDLIDASFQNSVELNTTEYLCSEDKDLPDV
ncbi:MULTISPECIES: hypothetical protein [Bacillus cereus group]|uniref:hypothetical protein n=1 Tax=Bacillus cereus group TaxID=86661 RepID=UPI0012AB2E9F|nr:MULTISPECIES: hypothetical protein [Bacillus cereus group]MDA1997196.1 hypothetical protein [Bacillus cereus]MDA2003043.1 hypothetical protein [Bacillus cereus]WPQ41647.1 hypothetical protein SH594_02890 [Bacillus cereus]